MAMKFSSNKQEWVNLGEYVAAAMACVIESLPNSREPREDLHLNIEKLADTMHHIQHEISLIRQQSAFARALAFGKDPDKILSLRKELDDALNLFHLKSALTTGLDVAKILDGVNVEQLLERVNAKLTDTIVSAINLNSIPCAEGASWDPNPNNACLPNTRVELLQEIMSWIESPDRDGATRIFWLSSVAGGGKTAVANTVAKLCHEKGLLAASFFFDRKTAGRNEPKRLFSTLARGLANYSREVAVEINRAIEDDQSVATAPIFRQFEELLRLPSLCYSGGKPIVFVIDGLDEGLTTELLQILRDEVPRLQNFFRIFATSRLEPQIASFLANKPHIRRLAIDIQAKSNADDITLFATRELQEVAAQRSLPGDWPGAELLKEFTAKAGGLFIWVSVVCRYLSRISYPQKKLAALLSKSSNRAPTAEAQMDSIYSSILESCDWEDEDFVEGYGLIIGAIAAAKTPLSINALQSLHRNEQIQVDEILRPISSLIASDLNDVTQPVQILHLSLQEFLTSRAQLSPLSTKFYVGDKEHSQRLAYLCLTILNAELDLDIPGIGFLRENTPGSKLPGIPALSASDIPETLWYACVFWVDHLLDVVVPGKGLLDELQAFLSSRLAPWLEILTGTGQFQNLERLLNRPTSNPTNARVGIPESAAHIFHNLSYRLTYMDRREDALSAIEQAVTLLRQRNIDRPALAQSITTLSDCLTKLGRREEALKADEEALALFYQLAEQSPATYNRDVARSLHNRSVSMADLGRSEDALEASEQAVVLHRQLTAGRPVNFKHELAGSLNNHSNRLTDLGRREDALDAAQEAAELYFQLAAYRPGIFESHRASSLNNLSSCLSDLGRREDALKAVKEAVELYRPLAADRPAIFNPDLAISLNNLSNRLSELGFREDALDAIQEAVQLYRQLATDRPTTFNAYLASPLHNLSQRLSDLGRQEDALDAIQEALQLYRQLAADRPATFHPPLAQCLNTLFLRLSALGRLEESLEAIEQVVALRRQLAADRPAVFNLDLALSFHNLSLRLSDLDRQQEALVAIEQAVPLYRQLDQKHPTVHTASLVDALNWLSTCLVNLGRNEEAHGVTEEAQRLTL